MYGSLLSTLLLIFLIGNTEPVQHATIKGRLIHFETKQPIAHFKGVCSTNSLEAFGTGSELGRYQTDSTGHFSIDISLTKAELIIQFLFVEGSNVTISHLKGPLIDLGDVPMITYDNELEILEWDSSYACPNIPDNFRGRSIETVIEDLTSTPYTPQVDTITLGQSEKGYDSPQCMYRYKGLSVSRNMERLKP